MVLTYSQRLVETYIKKQMKSRNIPKVLSLSRTLVNLPSVQYTEQFYDKNVLQRLPFPNQSFDFIYCENPIEVFSSPCNMHAELLRVGKSGLIRTDSPLSIVLQNNEPKTITWTDTYSNTLCFMPFYGSPNFLQLKDWDRICLNKPYYLHDWYSWTSSYELNIRVFIKEIHFEDIMDYELLFQDAVEESAKNTANVINN